MRVLLATFLLILVVLAFLGHRSCGGRPNLLARVLTTPVEEIIVVSVCMFREKVTLQETKNLIKSLLFTSRTQHPVRLILLVDAVCKKKLLQDLPVPLLHPTLRLELRLIMKAQIMKWWNNTGRVVGSRHHSGFAGLCYSFLDLLLPEHEKIISVDSDVVFVSDIFFLWKEFDHFGPNVIFGQAINDLPASTPPCSWVRQNFGVTLWHLQRFRQIPFRETGFWASLQQRAKKYRSDLEFVAAQHWINYFCCEKSDFDRCRTIPFNWNIQICKIRTAFAKKNQQAYFPDGQWLGAIHENCVGDTHKRTHRFSPYFHFIQDLSWDMVMVQPNR